MAIYIASVYLGGFAAAMGIDLIESDGHYDRWTLAFAAAWPLWLYAGVVGSLFRRKK